MKEPHRRSPFSKEGKKIDKDDKIFTMASCVLYLSLFLLLLFVPFSSNFIKYIQVHSTK